MATFVDGDENEVDHQERPLAAKSLVEKQKIKNQPRNEGPSRDGLPVVFERVEERQTIGDGFRKVHGAECSLVIPIFAQKRGGRPRRESLLPSE